MLSLGRFSFGVGDRFAHQASAQLRAFQKLAERGIEVVPVWNKSNREHTFIGSEPSSVREAAQEAVRALGWRGAWHVDADHIQRQTVDRFLDPSDFFTIDVLRLHVSPLHLILPAGISFHTFQSLSYTIDVYKRQIPATRSVTQFATFVLFFPQLAFEALWYF